MAMFLILQFRGGAAIAMWKVPAKTLTEALLTLRYGDAFRKGDTFEYAWLA